MSLPVRSARVLDLQHVETPSTVAPGSYVGHAQYVIPQSKVSFSTTSQRYDMASAKRDIPGPGTYSEPEVVKKTLGAGLLSSTAPRLIPVGAAQNGFSACSYVSNPGPGQYNLVGSWLKKNDRDSNKRSSFSSHALMGSDRTPSAIPVPGQNFGYEPDEYTGRLKPQQETRGKRYSGVGEDRVGPGEYDTIGKDRVVPSTKFGSSRSKRMPIGSNACDVPGPGSYEPGSRGVKKKSESRGTSSFASKVPMAHELASKHDLGPGPGEYLGPSSKPTGGRQTACSIQNFGFGSSAFRSKVGNTLGASTPGPGSYGKTKRQCWLTWKVQQRERRNNPQIGFASTAKRGILEVPVKEASPPMPERKVASSPGGKRHVGRLVENKSVKKSVFGTTSLKRSMFEEQANKNRHPGPGEYTPLASELQRKEFEMQRMKEIEDQVAKAVQLQAELQMTPAEAFRFDEEPVTNPQICLSLLKKKSDPASSMFSSKTKRFPDGGEEVEDEKTQPILTDAQPPSRENRRQVQQQGASGSSCFRSTSTRFSGPSSAFGHLEKHQEDPGPGQYSQEGSTRPKGGADPNFGSNTNRFQEGPQSLYCKPQTDSIGPGAYDISRSMVKRSHNITMTKEKPFALPPSERVEQYQ